jgi:hypothetical protein
MKQKLMVHVRIWDEAIVERFYGRSYRWTMGYSERSPGGVIFPWMTRRECQEDARRRGAKARFRTSVPGYMTSAHSDRGDPEFFGWNRASVPKTLLCIAICGDGSWRTSLSPRIENRLVEAFRRKGIDYLSATIEDLESLSAKDLLEIPHLGLESLWQIRNWLYKQVPSRRLKGDSIFPKSWEPARPSWEYRLRCKYLPARLDQCPSLAFH